jgi:hypothetical protein
MGGNVLATEVTSPSGHLTQTCSGGNFQFTLQKTTDGTYNLSFKQTLNGVDSGLASLTWILDTAAPVITISSVPSNPNMLATASFSFSANEPGATFKCKLDEGTYSTCNSPDVLSAVTNGVHTFSVQATDAAGNVSTPATYTWTQGSYNTIALYHLNNSDPTIDSGNYTALVGFNNNLTAIGGPTNDTTGVAFAGTPASSAGLGNGKYYSAASNGSLQLGTNQITIEGFFKLTTTIPTGTYYTLVSKTGSAAPDFGWEVRMNKTGAGGGVTLSFVGSTTGSKAGTVVTSSKFTANTGAWYYFAVTVKAGAVNFYSAPVGGKVGSKGSGLIGGTTLATTAAPLRIGANATSSGTGSSRWFSGAIDEIRISQTVRNITVPTAQFMPD